MEKVKVIVKNLDTGKRKCRICGYIYDPQKGDPLRAIPPGTPFEDLADSWRCPTCEYSKAYFLIVYDEE